MKPTKKLVYVSKTQHYLMGLLFLIGAIIFGFAAYVSDGEQSMRVAMSIFSLISFSICACIIYRGPALIAKLEGELLSYYHQDLSQPDCSRLIGTINLKIIKNSQHSTAMINSADGVTTCKVLKLIPHDNHLHRIELKIRDASNKLIVNSDLKEGGIVLSFPCVTYDDFHKLRGQIQGIITQLSKK